MKTPKLDLNRMRSEDRRTVLKLVECAQCLYGVVGDVMPQIGGIVLQDYEQLNRGLLLAENIFGKPKSP